MPRAFGRLERLPGQATVHEATSSERLTFIRKVYSTLLASFVAAGVGALLTMRSAGVLNAVAGNYFLVVILEFAALFFAMAVRRKPLWNVVGLYTFTFLSGITLGVVLQAYAAAGMAGLVAQAALLTAVAFGGLTTYAFVTRKDFSFLRGFLFVGLLVLIVGGLLNAFVFESTGMRTIMSIGGVLIFSGYILYDTSRIILHLSPKEYTAGALSLYLDVINLFLYILALLSGGRD